MALVAVLVMHYYDNSGFYTVVMDSPGDFAMAALRLLFTVCVPFFLMLIGYLCHRKILFRRYHLGLLRILALYVLCAGSAGLPFPQLSGLQRLPRLA